ncbi:MAG: phosphonate ABC transporter substrate-binding protein [Pseudorhodoplanes sp.]|nr:phosphonate ABC transporter substrate-binding protein [Pseudorhodoplanes sp.]
MKTVQKAIGAVAGAALLMGVATAPAAQAQEINFGIISTETSSNLKTIWQPFLEAMAKGTGLKVNGFYASDYAGVIEAMRFNKVQVAWFGNKSAMEAVNRADGEIFAQSVDAGGNPGYWSHLIVHKDSPYEKLEDVMKCDKAIDFGIGDPNSTSGFLVPTAFIFAAKNVDPKQCFKTVRNASHEANAMAVANKQVAVATNNSESLQRLEKTAPEARKNLKVIWTSPLIPSDPLVWRKDLDPAVKAKLYTWIMTYGRLGTPEEVAEARKVLTGLQWAPFRPSSNAQLFPIQQLEINKEMLKVKGDAKLSDAEKTAKLADLQKQLEKIDAQAQKTPSM